jgi:hypothetical protein
MSSRTAACGQPPVSMARMRGAGRAEWRVRNSASSLFWRGGRLDGDLWARGLEGELGLRLPGKDVVGDGGDAVLVSEREAKFQHQGCLA